MTEGERIETTVMEGPNLTPEVSQTSWTFVSVARYLEQKDAWACVGWRT